MMQKEQPRLTRRDFLRVATLGTGAVAAGGLGVLAAGAAPGGAGKPGGGAARNPLFVPPTITPIDYPLTAAPATVDLGGGQTSNQLAYNGLFPGPTLQASSGDQVSVDFSNRLTEETTVHWHGMVVPHEVDGHPLDAVAPGGTFSYQYQIRQRAALNWYHPHPHMLTASQVANGLAGAFILRDSVEAGLGLPSGAYEVPLIIRDADFDRQGNLLYKPRSSGYLGKEPLVNGTRRPKLAVDQGLYRFRVLDGANGRVFRLALSTGANFWIVGNDGGLLETPVQMTEAYISMGERLDLVVDFSGLGASSIFLRDLESGWDLLEFVSTNQPGHTRSVPTQLSAIPPLTAPVRTREFSFDGMSRINGQQYDLNRIDWQVPFGEVEKWVFRTNGNAPHPVHIHGMPFQVQGRTGGRGVVYPYERGWKDTVLLADGETVEVLVRFDAYKGLYLMHCHKLEHEDMGMMANFEVV
jgi:FtsP/CotA-like multicopper oxidase with cupredoxin domain